MSRNSDDHITLGIESSCDETGVAVVANGSDIRTNVVASQAELHEEYGGVVPEVACRAHVEAILPVIEEACQNAEITLKDVDLIGVTRTPGLIGSLLIGVQAAKALSLSIGAPMIGVNHIEAHLFSCAFAACSQEDRSIEEFPFPQIGLVVSGGHTGIYKMKGHGDYERLGSTIDDAVGEAFDKVAATMGLSYPGGPAIQEAAEKGDPNAVDFPRPMSDSGDYNFSYSGLKTAVLYHCRDLWDVENESPPDGVIPDIAASFQEAAIDSLVNKVWTAFDEQDVNGISVGGGVAANHRLRNKLQSLVDEKDLELFIPPISLCTDNGAMIAGKAYHLAQTKDPDRLDMDAVPT